jgi:hypothetical protein
LLLNPSIRDGNHSLAELALLLGRISDSTEDGSLVRPFPRAPNVPTEGNERLRGNTPVDDASERAMWARV